MTKADKTNTIKFGPSGNSVQFYEEGNKHTNQAAEWLYKQGLNAFEYSFGRGVNIGDDTARAIADEIKKYDIALSGHAPYFINFGSEDDQKILKSYDYVLDSVKTIKLMGGKRVIVHSGVQGKLDRQVVVQKIKTHYELLMQYLDQNTDGDFVLCPESMGKYSQIGSYSEIFDICSVDPRVIPCLDFGHINCIEQGALKTVEDFVRILDSGIGVLGQQKMQNFHVHFSKIQYGKAGELRHLTFGDSEFGPDYKPFLQAITAYKLTPTIICESDGTQSNDAKTMKEYCEKL